MRFTAKRLLIAGAIGISTIVTPIALTVGLPTVTVGTGPVASAASGTCTPNATFDEICYIQSSTSPQDTYQYEPATGTPPAPQTASISGNCGTVSGGSPLLNVCGFVYSPNDYTSAAKAASLGTNVTATGVGAISPAWTIDNKVSGSKQQAEAIDFSPGSATAVAGRQFGDAQIAVQRKDTGVAQNPSVGVQLVEFDSSGTLVGTQSCTIAGNTGTQITADTNGPGTGACSGSAPGVFQRVEVRDTTPSTSISVVNTSVFTLLNEVCGGHSINTPTGDVVGATLYMTGSSTQCKTYTNFSSSIDSQTGSSVLNFNGTSNTPVTFTIKITWPLQAECQPYTDGLIPADLTLPMCPPHQISVNGTDYFDQAYCQSPNTAVEQPQGGMCTISKTYTNDQQTIDPSTGAVTGTTGLTLPEPPCVPTAANNNCAATQISEVWVGDIDMNWR